MISRRFKKKRDFFYNLFEYQIIPEPIKSIEYKFNLGFILLEQDNYEELWDNNSFFSVKSVPEYISTNINTKYKVKKILQYHKGYSILIDQKLIGIDDYLKIKFKSKAREIRRYVKRLETCYDISYKMHYGEISQNEYEVLFEALHSMLKSRFNQKNEINDRLLEWKRLYDLFYPLINEKKASIFVIYESNTPISISLNYIFDKFYFNAIASYNINYSKFGLGNVIIYKQLEWCINNKFIIYEMGRGDYDYKRRWSNNIYNLNHYIILPKKLNVFILLLSKVEFVKIKFSEYLRLKKVNIIYNRIKLYIYRLYSFNNNSKLYVINKFNNPEILLEEQLINFKDDCYLKLQKPINDFLFSNSLYKNNLKVYKYGKSFILKGNNTYAKIIFT